MPKFKIQHVTKYSYDVPVRDSSNQIMLFPVKDEYQEVLKQELVITGHPHVEVYVDYHGNEVGSFMHPEPHNELVINSNKEVFTRPRSLPTDTKPKDEQWDYLKQMRHNIALIDFLTVSPVDALPEIAELKEVALQEQFTPLETAKRLNQHVFDNFLYIKGVTNVETTIDEIWKLKAGVCQDFAHILSLFLRLNKIPARYVSGYVCPNKNGMRGEGATHAWVEAYIPFYGWLGFDPTNNVLVSDLHVRLAVGRNFGDCSPVKGTYKGTSNQTLEVGVTVSYEDGHSNQDLSTFLTPQPHPAETRNSYRKFLEMQQQQQQQQ